MTSRRIPLALGVVAAATLAGARGAPMISEFMAVNDATLADEDGDFSDWIEIHNPDPAPADLEGWHLTDRADNPTAWTFPRTVIPPGGHLVVFASGKDRTDADAPLHTDFRLSGDGEYLALTRPDGSAAAPAFDPFPRQLPDVAFGIGFSADRSLLLAPGATARIHVPDATTGPALADAWMRREFVPGTLGETWTTTPSGIGFDLGGLLVHLVADPQRIGPAMFNTNPGAWIRFEFDLSPATLAAVDALTLRMQHDDGFVAYLNGEEIASDNAPDRAPDGTLPWNRPAASDRPDEHALAPRAFRLDPRRDLLESGTNVLAIHGLNASAGSLDFLILPELEAAALTADPAATGYLATPTPGAPNVPGDTIIGPVITTVSASPTRPTDEDAIVVAASVAPVTAPIGSVVARVRVGFGAESPLPMRDDGVGDDAHPGDGVFTATIPAGAAGPGEMVRWRILATDTAGTESVSPPFPDPEGSPEYHGTVIADPSLQSPLPVLHWFVRNPAAAETAGGTRCSLFFEGAFHDNVFVRIRGATARNWPKKSFKFDFNRRDHFRFHPDERPVEEINVNTTYTDKSYVRSLMAYEAFHAVGHPASITFPLRIQRNGAFHSVAHFVEQVDEDFLSRNGLDPDGALYKANLNTLGGGDELGEGADGMDKKTRRHEDKSDILALIDSVSLRGPALERFLFDQIDIPAVVNFMATSVVIQDIDRWATNFYVHRDSDGTGEWRFLPWDVDLTFGPDRLNTNTIVANQDTGNRASHPLLGSAAHPYSRPTLWNGLLDAMFRNPRTLAMFHRRLRSIADQLLVTDHFPDRIAELHALMADDVALDRARWGGSAHFGGTTLTMQAEGARIVNEYVVPRRHHLLVTHGGPSEVPASQPATPDIRFGAIEFNPPGGNQDEEFIELTNPNAFAVDVSDWRLDGGVAFTLRPGTVIPAGGSLHLTPDVNAFRARAASPRGGEGRFVQGPYAGHLSNLGEELVLSDARGIVVARTTTPFAPSDAQRFLAITEVMYHPAGDPGAEFIELLNTSDSATLDLEGVRFTDGVTFAFSGSAVTRLPPGERVLVVRNQAAFEAIHGTGLPVAGEFADGTALSNQGESVKLDDASNSTIREFTYDDAFPWPPSADGGGASLVLVAPADNPDPDDPANWRPSAARHGNPGTDDAVTFSGNPLDDSDANGIADLIDHLMGNDTDLPATRPIASTTLLPVDGTTALHATLAFRRRLGADDARPTVEVSTDLVRWTSGPDAALPVESVDLGDGTTLETWRTARPLDPDADHPVFLRLRATIRP